MYAGSPGAGVDVSAADAAAASTNQPVLIWVAAGLIALSVLAFSVVLSPSLQTRRERRLASIDDYVAGTVPTSRRESRSQVTPLTEQLIGFGERQMQGKESTKSTMALITRADLPFRAGEWYVLRALAGLVGLVLVAFLLRESDPVVVLVGATVGAVVGVLLPALVLKFLAGRRANAFERVLPDVLMLVSTSLRSGFGLAQALDAVGRDAAEPAAKEFSRALAEARIGTDISDALDHMATRMNSTSMRWAVMAIRIQREVGGNLADTLHTTASTLKERESIRRQVRALSAEGRLSAYILVAMPIGIFLFMMYANYEYISQLWLNPIGILMLIAGAVMMVVGIFWMRQVVKIEV
jgi:tight adherence protein B